jgi:hypothetical protein
VGVVAIPRAGVVDTVEAGDTAEGDSRNTNFNLNAIQKWMAFVFPVGEGL